MNAVANAVVLAAVLASGSEHFPTRECASATIGLFSNSPVIVWGSKRTDPEIARRCKRALPKWITELERYRCYQELCRKWPKMPWYDGASVLWGWDCDRYYRRAKGSGSPDWSRWRNATRLMVWDWLEVMSDKEIQWRLEAMHKRDLRWIRDNLNR